MDLNQWSKAELIVKIQLLQFELEQLKKAITGPRSERLVVINPDQASIFPEDEGEVQEEIVTSSDKNMKSGMTGDCHLRLRGKAGV